MSEENFEDCPIVDSFCVKLNYSDEEHTLVSPSTDIIMRYTVPEYDHLRLWEQDEHRLKALFLSQHVLAQLVEVGIPESEEQETIPSDIYDLWERLNEEDEIDDEAEDRIIFGIEEDSDEAVASDAMKNWDSEWKYWSEDGNN